MSPTRRPEKPRRALVPASRHWPGMYRPVIYRPGDNDAREVATPRARSMSAPGLSDKAQAEHNTSAVDLIADMRADMDFCRSGP
jgi:hypothetical protein